ncbi:MAG: alpha/beta hydrolase [Candidatus Kaiserbacteria bacterium]|nr:alpha/beta hydrolase [Candidatus Kaiserbacteria bacterium]
MTVQQKLVSWLIDYCYMLRGFFAMEIHRIPPERYRAGIPGKTAAVLIPGILGTWAFMKDIGDRLSLAGHAVYTVPALGNNMLDIASSAKIVQSLIERENIHEAVLVTHSKGGLIGKHLLAHQGAGCVPGMVAIAAPFSGSRMARLVPLRAFRELDTESAVIHELAEERSVNDRIISIMPEYDNHVWAEQGSYLEGAQNITVAVRGHHKVLFSPQVWDAVVKAVEEIALRK